MTHTVGVLKEVKDQEKRVGLTPLGAARLVNKNIIVNVERDAGLGAGFSNMDYVAAGAFILIHSEEIVNFSDIIVKVKEPVPSEYPLLERMKGKTLFTFLHLADNPDLAKVLLDNEITGVSYDTIEDEQGRLPLLKPMSEIAGRFAVDFFYQEHEGGTIKNILVVGGGVTGTAAARQAVDLGCQDVVIFEKNLKRGLELEKEFYNDPVDVFICAKKLDKLVAKADLLVGAVLVKGSKCPEVVTKEMIAGMKPDGFISDISIDQGGCIYGSKPTSHTKPTFDFMNQKYMCISNMPGRVPREATLSLTDATFPYLLGMATKGVFQYLVQEPRLLKGMNTHAGKITNATIATDLGMRDQLVELDK